MHYKVRAGFCVLVASGLAGFLGNVEHIDCLQVIPQKNHTGLNQVSVGLLAIQLVTSPENLSTREHFNAMLMQWMHHSPILLQPNGLKNFQFSLSWVDWRYPHQSEFYKLGDFAAIR